MKKFDVGQKVRAYTAEGTYVGFVVSEALFGDAVYFVEEGDGRGQWFHWRQLVKLVKPKDTRPLFGR